MDEKCRKVLAADVGGTKSNLGLYLRKSEDKGGRAAVSVELLAEARYENSEYASFDEILREFLKEHLKGASSTICCATFGVAATVQKNRCTMTNLAWKIDAEELAASFGFHRCALINDLVALGWGVTGLGEEDLHPLQTSQNQTPKEGPRALLAAGTGLGEAILIGSDSEGFAPLATEGGHTDFAPTDSVQVELLGFLSEKYGHVSYERVLSGSALKDIFYFFVQRRGGEADAEIEARFATEAPGAVITEQGQLDAGDRDCKDALDLFVSVYGAEAGNLALKCLATGGVYIGGGIAPKILSALEGAVDGIDGFIESFVAKGRFEEFMRTLPVVVILNDKTALLGAAIHAATALGSNR
ncbi:MAG: glucokinase [Proteobacteria bacterium]|nr:glucokinase [Pseudomonadota bacterium]